MLGSILASLVVLLFMRSWRSTLIAAIAIPCSVISTFGMMKALASNKLLSRAFEAAVDDKDA